MKLAVAGKGGVGKTTFSALLAGYLADEGRSVIAVDADPVTSLGGALGIEGADSITPISQMQELIAERTGTDKGYGQFFTINPRVDDLPEQFARVHGNIRLMVLGGVAAGGSGCFCPESAILKALVTHLVLRRDEVVLLDMEAGIEHLGRATAVAVSPLIVVVEPGMRSIRAAHTTARLASEIGVRSVVAVINKVLPETDIDALAAALAPISVIGEIPFDPVIQQADFDTKPVYTGSPEQRQVLQSILDAIELPPDNGVEQC
jgi:CO dehydrogenase maturation factor